MNRSSTSALLVGVLTSIAGCYMISVEAAREHGAVVATVQSIARDGADLRLLRAELRTRSRLPELQRWNEQALALAAPRAEQVVSDPVMLASFVTNLAGSVSTAVVRDASIRAPAARAATYSAAAQGVALVPVGFHGAGVP